MAKVNRPTDRPNIDVHITYKDFVFPTTLRGYAVRHDNGFKLEGATVHTRVAASPEDIPRAERYLIAAVMSALPGQAVVRRTPSTTNKLDPENEITKAFLTVKASEDPISPDWGESTHKRWMQYFERNILPVLQPFAGEEFLTSDLEELRKNMLDDILDSGKSKKDLTSAENTVSSNLASANLIYKKMRDENPDLPDITFSSPRSTKRVLREQIKCIPEPIRQRFYRKLEMLAPQEPKMVFCATLMVDCGHRTAEAAGTIPQDLEYIGDHAVVLVAYQEDKGKRNPILKTDDAYRTIPLSRWGTFMTRLCSQYITDVEDNTEDALIKSSKLSAWILQLLKECGCDDAFFATLRDAQATEPELDKNKRPINDLSAYIWRRDRTDRWRNICGLTCDPNGDSEIDALLGHMTYHKRLKYDYRLKEKLVEIIPKLERYVYSTSISGNPTHAPIPVDHKAEIELIPFPHTRLKNISPSPLTLHLDIEAHESAEAITLITPIGAPKKLTFRSKNTKGTRAPRPIIGNNHFKEDNTHDTSQ